MGADVITITESPTPKPTATFRAGSVLIAWELGANMGHLMPILPIVRRLRERGHQVTLVVRDVSRIYGTVQNLDVAFYQAPVKTGRPSSYVAAPRSFAHILHNSGYADANELQGLAEAWRNLFLLLQPDVILCDHSPTAMLAARATDARVATTGTGFCCLPNLFPAPDFRPWLPDVREQLIVDERRVLDNMNRVLHAWSLPPLASVAQLYREVDECFLATFRELDHYSMRDHARYWGAWPNQGGIAPQWPSRGSGKRVFAYLHRFKMLPNILRLLKERQVPALVYCDALTPQLRRDFAAETLRFAEQPLDLSQVGSQCELAILNGGHGATVSMLLSGTPILQLPCQLEQTHTGRATTRLGAGLSVNPDQPAELLSKFTEMLASNRYVAASQRFAARYADYDASRQLDLLTARIEELVNVPKSRLNEPSSGAYQAPQSDKIQRAVWHSNDHDAPRTVILGIGTGRCGIRSLATLFNHQPSTAVSHEMRPLLPWDGCDAIPNVNIKTRFERLIDCYPQVRRVGDVAHFYLPYVERILRLFPDVRVLCMQRPRQDTIDSYMTWIAQTRGSRPVNHWAAEREGFDDDEWDVCFPKYSTGDMAVAVGRYWDEYYESALEFVRRFPSNVRIFPTASLGDEEGIRQLLDWASVPRSQQVVVKIRDNPPSNQLITPQA